MRDVLELRFQEVFVHLRLGNALKGRLAGQLAGHDQAGKMRAALFVAELAGHPVIFIKPREA
ncbi:hypothetical protein D3C72_2380310 [compost metagenome]